MNISLIKRVAFVIACGIVAGALTLLYERRRYGFREVIYVNTVCTDVPNCGACDQASRSLMQIWNEHKDGVAVRWQNIVSAYDEEFARVRSEKRAVALLEVGLENAGSLQIWKAYFGDESDIFGVSADSSTCSQPLETGIKVYCQDARDEAAMLKLFELQTFDVIIDDSGYSSASLLASFKMLFPKLRPGGVFLLEDVGSAYASDGFRRSKEGFMEFMKDIADMSNLHKIVWQLSGLPKQITDFQVEVGMWIDSIAFKENLVIIRKLAHSKASCPDVVQAGRNFSVGPGDPYNYFNNDLRWQAIRMRDRGFNVRI